jgi:probable rRNA maturation factor
MPATTRRVRKASRKDSNRGKTSSAEKTQKKRTFKKPGLKQAKSKASPKANSLAVDVLVESVRWNDFSDSIAIVCGAVMEAAVVLSTPQAELAIVLSNDTAIRELNRTWRGIDAATNVLSFPAARTDGNPPHLGDIVLACETVAAEAEQQRKPFADHLAHLAVHGFLHLLGYDHGSKRDAIIMEQIERNILQNLAIPDPYRQLTTGRV